MPYTSVAVAVSPSPSPSAAVDPNAVTPGTIGFVVFALIAVATVLLLLDFARRVRRAAARERARERVEAELEGRDVDGPTAPEE